LGEITVVCIEIDALLIKIMTLEEETGRPDGVRGRKVMRFVGYGIIRP
jgi:hypothetical protein